MKKIIPFILLLSIIYIGYNYNINILKNKGTFHPQPTETVVKTDAEEKGNGKKREEWMTLLHATAENVNWRKVELENALKRQQKNSTNPNRTEDCSTATYANGALTGTWEEKGSQNQAGSILNTYYDSIDNKLLVIGAGGSIFISDYDGSDWQVVNQNMRFDGDLLTYIPTMTGRRLLATSAGIPQYSDDDGATWQSATGVASNDNWAATKNFQIVSTDNGPNIYALTKSGYWENISLIVSTDLGASFQSVMTFNTNFFSELTMCKPYGTEDLYMAIDNEDNGTSKLSKLNLETNSLALIYEQPDLVFGDTRTNLVGTKIGEDIRFYAYTNGNKVMISEDTGLTWTEQGTLPITPWGVSMFLSPSNPDFLLTGGVECFKSTDKGMTWTKINNWGEYYQNSDGKLHADIMHFMEFRSPDLDVQTILISNHGGIHLSYDYVNSVTNIGLSGLNVSQYYDVKTDPLDANYIYAGAQDQGFQRSSTGQNVGPVHFDQVISGDYGHIAFSENGSHLWTVYPGGWVTYYGSPHNQGISSSWENPDNSSSVWIPPLIASPIANENAIFMAGGSADNTSGSYLVKLEIVNGQIEASNIDYDFDSFSGGGDISSIGFSKFDPTKWYVGTTNGRFFRSEDSGMTWEQTINFLPDGHYLYGAYIQTSKTNESTIYYMGSGYSNPPVYKSTDGGENFFPMSEGLPSTLVFKLVANADESLLFAATEAGPFVFNVAEQMWYPMAGTCAPNQTYWSVEYVESLNKVRFGTYGRGIWDFNIEISSKIDNINTTLALKTYPNPATNIINIDIPEGLNEGRIKVINMAGQLITEEKFKGQLSLKINSEDWTPSTYIVQLMAKDKIYTSKIVKK